MKNKELIYKESRAVRTAASDVTNLTAEQAAALLNFGLPPASASSLTVALDNATDSVPFSRQAVNRIVTGTASGIGQASAQATATGSASDAGTAGETITVGAKTYSIVDDSTPDENIGPEDIKAGSTGSEYASNIAAKVTEDEPDTGCTCSADSTDLLFTATAYASSGNDLPLSTTDPNLTLGSFSGGVDAGTLTLGGLVGTVNVDFDKGEDAPSFVAQIIPWANANKASIPALFINDLLDGTFEITFEPGAAANDLETSATDPSLSFGATTSGVDSFTIQAYPEDIVVTGAESGFNLNPGILLLNDSGDINLTKIFPGQIDMEGSDPCTPFLPVVATFGQTGMCYAFDNRSSVSQTVKSSGGSTVQVMSPGSYLIVKCIAITGTDATSWRVFYSLPGGVLPAKTLNDESYTTLITDMGRCFDAVGGDPTWLYIDDNLTYPPAPDNTIVWSGSNTTAFGMTVSLANTPGNMVQGDGTTGAVVVGQWGSFVVRRLADGVTYLVKGDNLTPAP